MTLPQRFNAFGQLIQSPTPSVPDLRADNVRTEIGKVLNGLYTEKKNPKDRRENVQGNDSVANEFAAYVQAEFGKPLAYLTFEQCSVALGMLGKMVGELQKRQAPPEEKKPKPKAKKK